MSRVLELGIVMKRRLCCYDNAIIFKYVEILDGIEEGDLLQKAAWSFHLGEK